MHEEGYCYLAECYLPPIGVGTRGMRALALLSL